jgi:hypothetical protein
MVPIDWSQAEKTLEDLARVSGARAYVPENTFDLAPIYDDVLANLKVRYVITYTSSSNLDRDSPRTVRVELIDPKTRGPLQIVDSNGKTVRAKIVVQDSYTPTSASARIYGDVVTDEMIENRRACLRKVIPAVVSH